MLSDICFMINGLHFKDINIILPLYTLSRQKKFQDCWKKRYSKLFIVKICQLIYGFLAYNLWMKLKVLV